jgi:hypothetical protein
MSVDFTDYRQRPIADRDPAGSAAGGQSFGIPSWTGNESISRNPSGVPILDSFSAHGAFKAADLARLCNVFAAVINRAALTSSMGTDHRVERVPVRLLVFLNLRLCMRHRDTRYDVDSGQCDSRALVLPK